MAAPHLISSEVAIDERKRRMRRALRGCVGDDAAIGARLASFLRGSGTAASLGAVWPLGGEPDLRPLLERLHAEGRALALPVVTGAGAPLLFRVWQPGDPLVAGAFGTSEPAPVAASVDPALILVPLLAFDRARRRLGRGGGFYDRTLRARPGVRAIGFAYASREVDEVPADPHDQVLDAIVTEREIIA